MFKYIISSVVFLCLCLTATISEASGKKIICFMFNTSSTDYVLSKQMYLAMNKIARSELGNSIDIKYWNHIRIDPTIDTSSYIIDALKYKINDDNCNLVIGSDYNQRYIMDIVAEDLKHVKFLIIGNDEPNKKNVSTYNLRYYESRYLQGIVAANLSKTGIIGYLGTYENVQTISEINAYYLGAKSINPNIKLKIAWINSSYDFQEETRLTNELIQYGVDILAFQTTTPIPLQIAGRNNVHAFGCSIDMAQFDPTAQLFTTIYNWFPIFYTKIQELLDDSFKNNHISGGLSDDSLQNVNFRLPISLINLIKSREQGIVSGSLQIFNGPLYDQSNQLRVKTGDYLSPAKINIMTYLLNGIKSIMDIKK